MEKLKKAEELYLRGFCGEYIKRRTGVSIQSLLKQLLSQGIRYDKSDIVNYQIGYIQNHYTKDEVEQAYRDISKKYPVLDKVAHGKHIECLGCGFGQYSKVFSVILGQERYKALRNECWSRKQISVMEETYGVKNAFEKNSQLLLNNPMHNPESREKRRQTMLRKYGVEHPNQNEAIKTKMLQQMKETNIERYGVENAMQRSEIAKKSSEKRQAVMLERYGAPNSVQIDDVRNRIFEARRKNGTVNSSQGEEILYEMLVEYFGKDDVCRNILVDSRYPYHVDFYIKSRDLFIELNGDMAHYSHWFNPDSEQDQQVLQSWVENMHRLEAQNGKKSRYRKYIDTWTGSDVLKRECARKNQLNYLVFWDGSRKIRRNKQQFPRLSDACDWFDAGCPDSKDWRAENTY